LLPEEEEEVVVKLTFGVPPWITSVVYERQLDPELGLHIAYKLPPMFIPAEALQGEDLLSIALT
jgi:hypothetical protein